MKVKRWPFLQAVYTHILAALLTRMFAAKHSARIVCISQFSYVTNLSTWTHSKLWHPHPQRLSTPVQNGSADTGSVSWPCISICKPTNTRGDVRLCTVLKKRRVQVQLQNLCNHLTGFSTQDGKPHLFTIFPKPLWYTPQHIINQS